MCAQRVQLKTTIDGQQVPLNPYTDCVKNVRQQMPLAGSKLLGTTVLYVGPQTDKYSTGVCYTCKATESSSYYWEAVSNGGDYTLTKEAVDGVIGASTAGSTARFYNEQGAFTEVDMSGYLPLSGGTLTGTLNVSAIQADNLLNIGAGNYGGEHPSTMYLGTNGSSISSRFGISIRSSHGYVDLYSATGVRINDAKAATVDDISTHATVTASSDTLGHIKVDNQTITVDENGVATAHAVGHNIFDIFYSMSSKAPAGAMDLSLGTLIASCDTVFPDFWSECLQRRGNAHMFPQFNGNFYYYWSSTNVIGYQGIDGFNGNAVCYYNGKIYVLAEGECDGHETPPPQSQEWRQFVVPTEQWDAQYQYSIGDTVLYNGQIWCARPKSFLDGYWTGIGIAPGTTDADGNHPWALYDLPTQIVAPSIRILTESEWQAEVTANGSCGAFVVNEEAKSVRLPKITNIIQPGDVGVFKAAGLPNITGDIKLRPNTAGWNTFFGFDGAFNMGSATELSAPAFSVSTGTGTTYIPITFDASRSSLIYGNSTTVQPPAVGAKLYIQVFTSAVPASMAQAGEFINMLEAKADRTELENYLPLSGGTMTGTISTTNENAIQMSTDTGRLLLHGGAGYGHGATIRFNGKSYSPDPGEFVLIASNGTTSKELSGCPDGTLTWNGQSVLNPIGTVIAFAGNSAPAGYLICNGAAVSRTTYAKLFAIIGTTYGAGDGSATFNLPNLTDKFIMGSGTAGTSKTAGLPNITGGFTTKVPNGHVNYTVGAFVGGEGTSTSNTTTEASYSGSGNSTWKDTYRYGFALNASKSSSIYGNSTTVQPPALTMRFYIKY